MKAPISHPWPVLAHCDHSGHCGQSSGTLLASCKCFYSRWPEHNALHSQMEGGGLCNAPVFGHQTSHDYSPLQAPDWRCLFIRLWILLFTPSDPDTFMVSPNDEKSYFPNRKLNDSFTDQTDINERRTVLHRRRKYLFYPPPLQTPRPQTRPMENRPQECLQLLERPLQLFIFERLPIGGKYEIVLLDTREH